MEYSHAQSALAANIQALAICERDYNKAQAEADKWERLYQCALKAKSDDSVIKDIQSYKDNHAKKARNMKAMLDEQQKRVNNLRDKLNDYGKTTSSTFITTINLKESEEQSKHIESSPQPVALNSDDFKNRLHKLETALEAMKAQIHEQHRATEELLKLNATALAEVRELIEQNCPNKVEVFYPDLDKQFEPLEAGSDVDDELMAMKAHLTGASPNQTARNCNDSPASSSTSP